MKCIPLLVLLKQQAFEFEWANFDAKCLTACAFVSNKQRIFHYIFHSIFVRRMQVFTVEDNVGKTERKKALKTAEKNNIFKNTHARYQFRFLKKSIQWHSKRLEFYEQSNRELHSNSKAFMCSNINLLRIM